MVKQNAHKQGGGDSFVLSRCAFRALRVLNARVAALRAAVGCGWTYRRCAAHVGMAPLSLGVLLLPPTFSGGASEFFELISAHKRAEIGSEQG